MPLLPPPNSTPSHRVEFHTPIPFFINFMSNTETRLTYVVDSPLAKLKNKFELFKKENNPPSSLAFSLSKDILNIIKDSEVDLSKIYLYTMLDGGIAYEFYFDEKYYIIEIYNDGEMAVLIEKKSEDYSFILDFTDVNEFKESFLNHVNSCVYEQEVY